MNEYVCVAALALVWVLCALVAAAIHRLKGRSARLTFLIGLLAGPLALVAALMTSRLKQCPSCAETVQHGAKVCRYCGYQFE
jgi:hypothetical protein